MKFTKCMYHGREGACKWPRFVSEFFKKKMKRYQQYMASVDLFIGVVMTFASYLYVISVVILYNFSNITFLVNT